jgi:hypothetical protein
MKSLVAVIAVAGLLAGVEAALANHAPRGLTFDPEVRDAYEIQHAQRGARSARAPARMSVFAQSGSVRRRGASQLCFHQHDRSRPQPC